MKVNNFLSKLEEETYRVIKEEESKDLAKEDALTLIAEFVKDVKKKFSKKEDKMEILRSAEKTLGFYINEIEGEEHAIDTSSVGNFVPVTVDVEEEPIEDVEDTEIEAEF